MGRKNYQTFIQAVFIKTIFALNLSANFEK